MSSSGKLTVNELFAPTVVEGIGQPIAHLAAAFYNHERN